MSAITSIGGMPTSYMSQRVSPAVSTGGTQTAPVQQNLSSVEASSSQSVASLSTTSIKSGSESLIACTDQASGDDLYAAMALLMLMVEYLLSDDDEEKKGLLSLMLAIAEQQQQQNSGYGEFLMCNSTSQSIECTQLQAASTEQAINAYQCGSAAPQQASSTGLGAAGLDVSA